MFYSKCGLESDLWPNLYLASELWLTYVTLDWIGSKELVTFNARKTQLGLYDRPNNFSFSDVKMDGSVLKKSHLEDARIIFF